MFFSNEENNLMVVFPDGRFIKLFWGLYENRGIKIFLSQCLWIFLFCIKGSILLYHLNILKFKVLNLLLQVYTCSKFIYYLRCMRHVITFLGQPSTHSKQEIHSVESI